MNSCSTLRLKKGTIRNLEEKYDPYQIEGAITHAHTYYAATASDSGSGATVSAASLA